MLVQLKKFSTKLSSLENPVQKRFRIALWEICDLTTPPPCGNLLIAQLALHHQNLLTRAFLSRNVELSSAQCDFPIRRVRRR
jgi:hypothetical protein